MCLREMKGLDECLRETESSYRTVESTRLLSSTALNTRSSSFSRECGVSGGLIAVSFSTHSSPDGTPFASSRSTPSVTRTFIRMTWKGLDDRPLHHPPFATVPRPSRRDRRRRQSRQAARALVPCPQRRWAGSRVAVSEWAERNGR